MHFTSLLLSFIFALCVSSQTINPDSVDYTTKSNWCDSSKAQCGLLCSQIQNGSTSTTDNSCDPDTLNYACICANGSSPPLKEYSLTIPYYECTTALTQCENACPTSNTDCQQNCRVVNRCGAQNPRRYNTTAEATSTTDSSALGAEATGDPSDQLINGAGADMGNVAGRGVDGRLVGVYGVVVSVGIVVSCGIVVSL